MEPKKNGLCCVIVGGTGSGKSTFAREKFINPYRKTGQNIECFDVNAEHGFDEPKEDFLEWLVRVKKSKNSLIFCEESTIFLNGYSGSDTHIKQLLVSKRHRSNNVLFIFHSFNALPNWLISFADYITIFETPDKLETVKKKFPDNEKVHAAFLKIKSGKKYDNITIKLR